VLAEFYSAVLSPVHPGKIKIEMELTEQLKISSEARVIRCFDKHESGLKEYRIAIQFENMTENQRDKIFKLYLTSSGSGYAKDCLNRGGLMASIRVLVVDDSAFMRKVISDIVNQDPHLEVVGQPEMARMPCRRFRG